MIIYVPGLREKASMSAPLLESIRSELGLAVEDVWFYPNAVTPFTYGRMESCAEQLCENVEDYWRSRGSPSTITLVGHSVGAALVRYAFLLALGELGGRRRSWGDRVTRIVLLSSPSRGFDFSRFPKLQSRAFSLLAWLFPIFAFLEVRAGSAFITNLRLAWMRKIPDMGDSAPLLVQVRGQNDDLVSREDGRDIELLPTGVDLFVPFASHGEMPRVDGVHEAFKGQRLSKLREAIIGDSLSPVSPPELPEVERGYQAIVFILHGIRAGNETWVSDLKGLMAGDQSLGIVTASYGRLSAYNFVFPVTRRRTLRWFQDQYSFYVARHPGASLHFVGHSNGTYLLGQSMRRVRAMRFDRVFLAGSVLPRKFDWRGYAANGRVKSLVNVCASKDKPVGWLCSMLNGIGMHDIGVGGFTGFDTLPIDATQLRYISGGHSAALDFERLPSIVDYLRSGNFADDVYTASPSPWFAAISRTAPYLGRLMAAVLVAITVYSVYAGEWLAAIAIALMLGLVYLALKIV
jgi:hypothetical protein